MHRYSRQIGGCQKQGVMFRAGKWMKEVKAQN